CLAAEEKTRQYAPYALNVLVNYGGRSELVRAARMLSGKEVPAESFRSGLYRPDLPDPDLIIRTGGERRLSGFMPFQSAYSELYFCDTLFPDFGQAEIDAALKDYSARDRRFGKIW
ncbi:MAG: undecaprenyl diphosphate synthase family protein, partial [Clostridia bacterium]|nr:undecaprenyl diphosphate synthase family protein [Clostridia bacterium]